MRRPVLKRNYSLVLGDVCPNRTIIFTWNEKFQRGNFTLENAERTEMPKTSVIGENA